MGFRAQFRDKQEWFKSTNGCIDLNTASDEAAKQYDATLTQLCGWYEDDTIGGLDGTIERMLKADEEFVLGRALALEIDLMGGLTAPRLNGPLSSALDEFNKLVERKQATLSDQERLHAKVVNHWANSELKQANKVLEQLITLYPEDLSAIKMNQDTYFFRGQALPMRNSLASCLSRLNKSTSSNNPLKGYAHGMFAFALEESNMYPQAEQEALKALALIPRDTWAIHNYAHCLEMQAKTEEGLKWMLDRQCDWQPCGSLACHQYWHTALFHINSNNFDQAIGLLDDEILTRCVKSCSSLDMHDASSMMYRMELVDLFGKCTKSGDDYKSHNNAKRWSAVYDMCQPHGKDHLIGFNDAHFMMSFLGMGDMKLARELIDTIDQAPSLNNGQSVVKPLLEAMYQFKLGAYDQCVDYLEPIRFDVVTIGGSHAQRDVFEQLLLVAALKSDKPNHNKLAERMICERDILQGRRTIQTELLAQA